MLQAPLEKFIQVLKSPFNPNSNKFFELMGFLRFFSVADHEDLDLLAVFF